MKIDAPKEILEVGFDEEWDNKKLWALKLPISWIDIKELEWHFDLPFLDEEGGHYNLKPRDVIDSPGEHQQEYYRTMQADMIHPIEVMDHKGRLVILDGLHRVMKAVINGETKIAVRIVPKDKWDEIKK
jgi:hypothetical protein